MCSERVNPSGALAGFFLLNELFAQGCGTIARAEFFPQIVDRRAFLGERLM